MHTENSERMKPKRDTHGLFQRGCGRFHLLMLFAVLLIGISSYSNSFFGEFHGDDYVYILNYFSQPNSFELGNLWKAYNTRFLLGLSYALNYRLGGTEALGYHIFNLISHLTATFCIYFFVIITLRTPVLRNKWPGFEAEKFALFGALIFLCHPIQTQSVNYIMQRAVSLATISYLGTILFYALGRLSHQRKYYFFALIFTFSGLFVKEMILTVGFTLLLYEFYFFPPGIEKNLQRIRRIVPFFVILGLFPVIISQAQTDAITQVRYFVGWDRFDVRFLFTEINVLRTYLRLLVFPINLNAIYDYPISNGFWELPTILSTCLLVALLVCAVISFNKFRLISFCIIWFFVTTSVEAVSIIFGNRDVIFEHWLYLPMVGYSLFFVSITKCLVKHEEAFKQILFVIIFVMSFFTYQRNKVWQTDIGLWHDIVQKSPRKSSVYFGTGMAYQDKHLYREAKEYYHIALELFHRHRQAANTYEQKYLSMVYNNLGVVSFRLKQFNHTVHYLKKSLVWNPENHKVYHNLGVVYFEMKQYPEAIESFQRSLVYSGDYPGAYRYMGASYALLEKQELAYENYQRALELLEVSKDEKEMDEMKQLMNSLVAP